MTRRSEIKTDRQAVEAFCFPRTPHLPGSSVVDDDRVLVEADLAFLCENTTVTCQEKLDGTNVGVFFVAEHRPMCQKRAGLIGSKEKDQYNVFRNWVFQNASILWQMLGTEWVLFGEWLWQTHAVFYDRLPAWFIAFDLLNRDTGRFVATDEIQRLVDGRLFTAPQMWKGTVTRCSELLDTVERLSQGRSQFSGGPPEGVYLRFERAGKVIGRAKHRRTDFCPGRKGPAHRNRLIWELAGGTEQ